MPECMVCIEVSSQYCVVCVQYVRHTVCYVFLRVGMIGVCSVSWRYVYIEITNSNNIQPFFFFHNVFFLSFIDF